MLPIIQAFIEDKEIQVFDDEKGWVETEYLILKRNKNKNINISQKGGCIIHPIQ